ncbi:MAG: DUF448 domain-containing protein, partial [bacterium]|nr:DUF448 domain-containing protein [bacterium]
MSATQSRTRHVPMRRCVVCRTARPKRELIRLVRGAAGWALDLRQRAGGRGTSLCPSCALATVRRDDAARLKSVRRAFRQETDAVAAVLSTIESTLAAAASATA